MDTSEKSLRLNSRQGPIWGSRGREFKFANPTVLSLSEPLDDELALTSPFAAKLLPRMIKTLSSFTERVSD